MIVLQQILWVPLDTQYESVSRTFDSLDDAVRRSRHDDEALADLLESLVVTAIHMQSTGRVGDVPSSYRMCQKAINLRLYDVCQVI